jgi:hypothetical protein
VKPGHMRATDMPTLLFLSCFGKDCFKENVLDKVHLNDTKSTLNSKILILSTNVL